MPETFRQKQRRLAGSSPAAVRRFEYPTVGDQLAALWVAIEKLSGTKPLPIEAQAVLDAIGAVKAKHPKS